MESLAVFVLVLAALFGNGSALLCRNCVSSGSFEECESMGVVQQCDATIVNANHAIHSGDNPTLVAGNGTEYKCYRIQNSRLHPNGTDTGKRIYARGCTFNSTNFCSGWARSVNVTSCGTCTTDNCDQNSVPPATEALTTTVAPRETTTVAPGATTTTVPEATIASGTVTTTVAPGTTVASVVTTTTVPEATTAAGTATTTIAPVASTTVATGTKTTAAPESTAAAGTATTTVEPSNTTTLASSETTTVTRGNATSLTPEMTTTLAPKETTTLAPGTNTTVKPRSPRSAKKFTIEGTGVAQVVTAIYIFCNIFTIVLTLLVVFAAYSIYGSVTLLTQGYRSK